MDVTHKVTKAVDYYRYTFLAAVLAMSMVIWLAGCKPKTTSIVDPQATVTQTQLEAEIRSVTASLDDEAAELAKRQQLLTAKYERLGESAQAAMADLQAQIELRQKIVNLAGGALKDFLQGGGNPASLVLPCLGIAGLLVGGGSYADSRRKDKIIASDKTGNTAATANGEVST